MASKYTIIPTAACTDKRLIPQHLRVLAIISAYGNQADGVRTAWPSYSRLATDVGITRRLLISYINHLCSCGYLIKKPRKGDRGGDTSNSFTIVLELNLNISSSDAPQHPPSDAQLDGGSDAPQHPLYMNITKEQSNKENNKKKKPEMQTLQQWEEKIGCQLCIEQMANWVKENKLDLEKVKKRIPIFREKMISQEKMYANFVATFQVWLREGWVGIDFEHLKLRDEYISQVKIIDKGLSL